MKNCRSPEPLPAERDISQFQASGQLNRSSSESKAGARFPSVWYNQRLENRALGCVVCVCPESKAGARFPGVWYNQRLENRFRCLCASQKQGWSPVSQRLVQSTARKPLSVCVPKARLEPIFQAFGTINGSKTGHWVPLSVCVPKARLEPGFQAFGTINGSKTGRWVPSSVCVPKARLEPAFQAFGTMNGSKTGHWVPSSVCPVSRRLAHD